MDSFTYTPYIDFSQVDENKGDARVGVYSDEFLNAFNTETYGGDRVDTHKHSLTSNLYTLRNLEKDLEDAKLGFRDSISKETDSKVYIYTFCQHLASLFAKLSNIRMCHEIYGLKHPHLEWEGILALDIWYQLLYLNIDKQYPFNDDYLNMNPMKVVNGMYVWDSDIWDAYKQNSVDIRNFRKDCVSPRGVLKKIYDIIHHDLPTEISDNTTGDFDWFYQKGKVYSDSDKSTFTKYVNLHLGRAYEVNLDRSEWSPEYGQEMIEAGKAALADAFEVVKNEKLFNIFNSSTNSIEEFNKDNADNYSQAQCAIVIERIFSRIYKYLQFKSTTGEVFQTHINIDSGYKYLTTTTLRLNQNFETGDGNNPISNIYYDQNIEGPDYLMYLNKVRQYLNKANFFTDDEKSVLGKFISILTHSAGDWLSKNWDMCPLLESTKDRDKTEESFSEEVEEVEGGEEGDVIGGEPSEEEESDSASMGQIRFSESPSPRAEGGDTGFTVKFSYQTEDGAQSETMENVAANTHIPVFHINQRYNKDGKTYVFRYWKLISGNLTSSLTALSDLEFEAVYDEIAEQNYPVREEQTVNSISNSDSIELAEEVVQFDSCESLKEPGEDESFACLFCSLRGIDPAGKFDILTKDGCGCPFVELMKDRKETIGGDSEDDFNYLTLLEIEDVSNLLKALFKVNIDIANNEWFLKIDIPDETNWWYGYVEDGKYISFEPTVEFKFSNLHAANQIVDGNLVCTVAASDTLKKITPVNRELSLDVGGIQYNDCFYCHDYCSSLAAKPTFTDGQNYYEIVPLHLYENTSMQSPVDVNDFVRRRANVITRSANQVRTFTSIVKKYRPIIMPKVRDIFNRCRNNYTKYEADLNNDYGVFGWCTIPSKTMVNMEYNEDAIIVPSSYDHHNRIGGENFLQMDADLQGIYEKLVDGNLIDNASNTWCYLYNTRDWTYFLLPFFNVRRNNELYTNRLD